jgi:DNA-binding MarR family transcriptional regulator
MNKETSTSRYELQLIELMHRMQHLRLGEFPKSRFELSYPQMQLLWFVNKNPGKHLQEVADGLEVTAPTASVSIRRMEEDGWLERRPDPLDGRATCVFLTDKSEKVMDKLSAGRLKGMRMFLSQLSVDEQEQLLALMEKAISGMEKKNNESTYAV